MKLVTVVYQPFRLLKFTRKINGNFPQKLEELTAKQIIAVACLAKGAITDIGFLQAMTGIKKRILNKLDDYQRFILIELFTMFRSAKPYNEFIIKELHYFTRHLVAPNPRLKGMTFGQFIFADTYFGDYQESQKAEDLHHFVAALYLPKNKKFDEQLIEDNSPWIAKLDAVTLEAITINYHLIREWLSEVYPLVFLKEEESFDSAQDDKKQPATKQGDGNGWIKIFEGIVGDDIINHDNYANLPIHNVLRFMSHRIRENMKRKR